MGRRRRLLSKSPFAPNKKTETERDASRKHDARPPRPRAAPQNSCRQSPGVNLWPNTSNNSSQSSHATLSFILFILGRLCTAGARLRTSTHAREREEKNEMKKHTLKRVNNNNSVNVSTRRKKRIPGNNACTRELHYAQTHG